MFRRSVILRALSYFYLCLAVANLIVFFDADSLTCFYVFIRCSFFSLIFAAIGYLNTKVFVISYRSRHPAISTVLSHSNKYSSCKYFTNNTYLPCTVHPDLPCENCRDYTPLS